MAKADWVSCKVRVEMVKEIDRFLVSDMARKNGIISRTDFLSAVLRQWFAMYNVDYTVFIKEFSRASEMGRQEREGEEEVQERAQVFQNLMKGQEEEYVHSQPQLQHDKALEARLAKHSKEVENIVQKATMQCRKDNSVFHHLLTFWNKSVELDSKSVESNWKTISDFLDNIRVQFEKDVEPILVNPQRLKNS